jgi:hypothetical protein
MVMLHCVYKFLASSPWHGLFGRLLVQRRQRFETAHNSGRVVHFRRSWQLAAFVDSAAPGEAV